MNKRLTLVVFALLLFVAGFITCMTGGEKKQPETKVVTVDPGIKMVQENCASCHQKITVQYHQTPHFNTSAFATDSNVLGSLSEPENTFTFSNTTNVKVEKKENGIYQTGYLNGVPKRSEKMDIVFGSGRKGQSFLYWAGNYLSQHPLTYLTPLNRWVNSPGYPGKLVFNRPISSRCMECHATAATVTSTSPTGVEAYDKNSLVMGITCGSCHGNAAEHIKHHTTHPKETSGKYITNTGALSRQQNLDMCMLCHGGALEKTQPSFSYQPGEDLGKYFNRASLQSDPAQIDVHGNQYGLLASSKCFQLSQMTCVTCHNVHEPEKKTMKVYSQTCMSCHSDGFQKVCGLAHTKGKSINDNCIDCHMPKQSSKGIVVQLEENEVPLAAKLRTHFIKVYDQ